MELVLYHHLTSSVHHLHLQDSEALSEGKKKLSMYYVDYGASVTSKRSNPLQKVSNTGLPFNSMTATTTTIFFLEKDKLQASW